MLSKRCSQENCPLNEGGLCLEGFDLNEEDCPHILIINEEEDTINVYSNNDNDVEIAIADKEDGINLFSGEALNGEELSLITYAHFSKLILIMGEHDSGKTTLLASIFNIFQKGSYAGYIFAGSKTQVGFEKRCHLARMSSGRTTPDTERTSSSDFSYLHLAMRKADLSQPVKHMLFTDVSGERFRLARDFDNELARLTILKQAAEIFYVVNGEHLTDSALRHSTKTNVIKMLSRIEQNNHGITTVSGIRILVSKWDKVASLNDQERIDSFFIKPIVSKFPKLIKEVKFLATRGDITGIDSFLQTCATSTSKSTTVDYGNILLPSREFYRTYISKSQNA